MWRPLCSLHQYTALHVTSWSESAKNAQKYRNNDDCGCQFDSICCPGPAADMMMTHDVQGTLVTMGWPGGLWQCRDIESTVTMSGLTQHFIILFMERFNVIIRIWIIMSNAQWIPDDLPARGCLISPMDFELGNYNVSQLLRQSRHKEQSWLSSCPDSFHRISGSRRISQLITQS